MGKVSNAEKQRLYRERRDADPVRRVEYLQKEKLAWQKKVNLGTVKKIAHLSERDQRQKRRYWKERQRECRQKQINEQERQQQATPPGTPTEASTSQQQIAKVIRKKLRVRQQTIKRLQQQLQEQKKTTEKYKKRCQRLLKKESTVTSTGKTRDMTPRSKTRYLLRGLNVTPHVTRTLEFHAALTADIKGMLKNSNKQRHKQIIAKLLTGKIVRKYRCRRLSEETFGFSHKLFKLKPATDLSYVRHRIVAQGYAATMKKSVYEYFTRDDISRLLAGKNATITKNGKTMQKRLLQDTLKNIHRKYLTEHLNVKMSYSLFCSLRPFFCLIPNVTDRDTCLCKTHENLQFMATKLHGLNVIHTSHIEDLAHSISCDPNSKQCMYGECSICKMNSVAFSTDVDRLNEISYYQWTTAFKPSTGNQTQTYCVTAKVLQKSTVGDLITAFQNSLHKFRRHVFNIRWQYKECRNLRKKMTECDCLIHIDFSENYQGKISREIQSFHFGGASEQVTLHTGVLYVGDVEQPISFCSISASRQHDPPAIWAHMKPVFEFVKTNFPNVTTLHFYSDGPSTQYKQKGNFYLLSTQIFELGFEAATWNFWEASHGKGAPDGIGGAIKRTADKLVANGHDINSAAELYNSLLATGSSIKLFFIECEEVLGVMAQIPKTIPVVVGTMRIHQVITTAKHCMSYRDVSCFCCFPNLVCSCYALKKFDFPVSPSALDEHETLHDRPSALTNHVVLVDDRSLSQSHESHDLTSDILESSTSVSTSLSTDQPIASNHNSAASSAEKFTKLDYVNDSHIGLWCAVQYAGKVYPGIIEAVEETDAEVKCMSRIGENRFFWSIVEDKLWYHFDDVIAIIPEPTKVGSRAFQICPTVWKYLTTYIAHGRK